MKQKTKWIAGTLVALTALWYCTSKENPANIEQVNKPEINYVLNSNDNLGVFLIDMQPDWLQFTHPNELKQETKNIAELLLYCKSNKVPVFVFETYSSRLIKEDEDPGFRSEYNQTIDSLMNVLYSFDEGQVHYYEKTGNIFYQSTLKKDLDKNGVKNIIGVGAYASACVPQTLGWAAVVGYNVMSASNVAINANAEFRLDDVGAFDFHRVEYYDSLNQIINIKEIKK